MDTKLTKMETTSSNADAGAGAEWDREGTRALVYQLNALGVALSLKQGRVAARPIDRGQPMPIEALALLREHKKALVRYLTTPPVMGQSCAACGRVDQWTLCLVGVWVCDCYYRPELRTWPRVGSERKS